MRYFYVVTSKNHGFGNDKTRLFICDLVVHIWLFGEDVTTETIITKYSTGYLFWVLGLVFLLKVNDKYHTYSVENLGTPRSNTDTSINS